jgi:hypothetical protein
VEDAGKLIPAQRNVSRQNTQNSFSEFFLFLKKDTVSCALRLRNQCPCTVNSEYVICEHLAPFWDTMFGLPLLTILTVGGVTLVIVIALILWGLLFREAAV